jgi:hypothetical protein
MRRRVEGAAVRVQGPPRRRRQRDIPAAALPTAPVSPAQQRIAQGLAALLVAHYRRQRDAPIPPASAHP